MIQTCEMKDLKKLPTNIQGLFPDETGPGTLILYRATGEKRAPNLFEYFLSGSIITAYRANTNQMTTEYWIAERVELKTCSVCNGRGEVAK